MCFDVLWLQNRKSGGITHEKKFYAKEFEDIRSLEEVCEKVKPTASIGAAAVGGAFTEKFLQTMAANNERPIIFALSNPTIKAECTAEQAYRITNVSVCFLCIFVLNFSPSEDKETESTNFHPRGCFSDELNWSVDILVYLFNIHLLVY